MEIDTINSETGKINIEIDLINMKKIISTWKQILSI